MAEEKKAQAQEKKEEAKPEMVDLKEVAKQAGVTPREARAILRKIGARPEGEKRQRWQFEPKAVAGVVAKIKKAVEEKAKAAEESAEAETGEEE